MFMWKKYFHYFIPKAAVKLVTKEFTFCDIIVGGRALRKGGQTCMSFIVFNY